MKYNNYKIIKEKLINEIDSKAILLEHEKTGARVLKVENSDNNKAFCISFRTVPNDSTGVAHIMEHSVLNGSRKFKAKSLLWNYIKQVFKLF